MSDPILVCLLRHGDHDAAPEVVDALPAAVEDHPVLVVSAAAGPVAPPLDPPAVADRLELPADAGLGALAREALAAGSRHRAAAVVLLDPNGEYGGDELPAVVGPVLHGDADYVVGSRFARGRPAGMARRRRFGNRILTRWVRRHTGLPVTDGQSGYRAFSAAAADAAEVVHDFNHTQVVTLDLVTKGFRYAEVPVTWSRTARAASWIRVGPYLRQVRRGLRRQLRTTAAVTAFGGPLDLSADPSDLVSPDPAAEASPSAAPPETAEAR